VRVDRSYSPYKAIREYADRGKMKWNPYSTAELAGAHREYRAREELDDLLSQTDVEAIDSLGGGCLFDQVHDALEDNQGQQRQKARVGQAEQEGYRIQEVEEMETGEATIQDSNNLLHASIIDRVRVRQLIDPAEKARALEKAVADIKKKCGGAILTNEEKEEQRVQALPSGVLSLDIAMGVGGYPRGRMIEIYGAESSGKTTATLHAVAETQKRGGMVAYIDVENSLDPDYATALGVDLAQLYLSQPSSAEEAFFAIERFVLSGAIDLIIVDSVASLTPQSEIEGSGGAGDQARLMSEQLRKLAAIVNKSKAVLIFINQTRLVVNTSGNDSQKQRFGMETTTPGGVALKFYSSIRIEVIRGESIRDDAGENIGCMSIFKVQKNKVAAPFRSCKVINLFGEGLSPYLDLLQVGKEVGVLTKSGLWYSYQGCKIGKGLMQAQQFMKKNTDIFTEVIKKVREKLNFH